MPKYSQRSKNRLATCHPLLQELFNEVIKHVDCTIIEGSRTAEKQQEYVDTGKSKTLKSKHLIQPDGFSHAVDVMICKIKWDFSPRNYMFIGMVRGIAASKGIKIRVGADWDGDFSTKDQTFHDLPHFELLSTEREVFKSSGTENNTLIKETLDQLEIIKVDLVYGNSSIQDIQDKLKGTIK